MKSLNLIITYLIILIASSASMSQSVSFTTQAEVDAFDPNITSITGSLSISGSSITDLSNLSNIETINGDFNIVNCTSLTNLEGLSGLKFVRNFMDISNNPLLTNIDGISNLEEVIMYFTLTDLPLLTNVDGLTGLKRVGATLVIEDNQSLANLNGLSNLMQIDHELSIRRNNSLTDCCGVQTLINTPGAIYTGTEIRDNPSSCSSRTEISNADCSPSLPVELMTFTALNKSDHVLLEWSTATEINNAYFEIESSGNGENWAINDRIDGYGDSFIQRDYTFKDYDIEQYAENVRYYRLKQVDYDLQYEYSTVQAVPLSGLTTSKGFKIYPNVLDGSNHLIFSMPSLRSLDIFTINGQSVLKKDYPSNPNNIVHQLDVSEFGSGFYIIIANGMESKRFVIID